MLASAELVAFVPVADLGQARAFYENILGLPCVNADRFACVFDCAGTTLRATVRGPRRQHALPHPARPPVAWNP